MYIFHEPQLAHMSIMNINGQETTSKEKVVIILEMDLSNMEICTNLEFPIRNDYILKFRLTDGLEVAGQMRWKEQESNLNVYGVSLMLNESQKNFLRSQTQDAVVFSQAI